MLFYNIVVDTQDSLFTLLYGERAKDGKGICQIWKLNRDGSIEKTYDISYVLSTDVKDIKGIRAFSIDKEGNYYIREKISDEMIVLDSSGNEVYRIKDNLQNIVFESMIRGKDGRIYALFSKPEEEGYGYQIVVYSKEGEGYVMYDGDILPYEDIYSVMGSGKSYDFLFKGAKGVYGYNLGDEKAKKLLVLTLNGNTRTKSVFMSEDQLFMFMLEDQNEKISMNTYDLIMSN